MVLRTTAVAILLFFSALFCEETKKKSLEWLTFGKALETSKKDKKPIYVYLYGTYCGWCKKFNKETLSDTTIINKLSQHFVITKLNTASTETQEFQGEQVSERQIATIFAVRGVPSNVFMDSLGTIIAKIPGYMPPDKFTPVLQYISDGWYKDMTYQEYIDSGDKLKKKK